MNDLPAPKYSIGDTVWYGRVTQTKVMLSCPDCLGTRKWKVVTPAGSELEADCQRCSGSWQPRGVPSLTDYTYEVTVEQRTIGSVRIDSANKDHPVQYMCRETGVGSGSVYSEGMLHSTKELALEVANAEARLKNEKRAATPEHTEKATFSILRVTDAAIRAAETAVWNSWYRYKNLREDIEQELGDEGSSSLVGLKEDIRRHLEWDQEHRDSEHDVFEGILKAAKALAEATERLPSLQAARRKAKAEEQG